MVSDFPKVPRAIMNAYRDESSIEMQIFDGNLPDDLQGHVFIVAPVGTVSSGGLPDKNGNTFMNGDGMIYRLDFDQKGKVSLKRKIAKSPDYWADKLTHDNNNKLLKFRNYGLVRFSDLLGFRNELNTAFLPIKFSGDTHERLLVTYDAGRPYEIDTETLEAVTPIGEMKEWEALLDQPPYPFKPILSTAHPAFDPHKSEMFTVNYSRSLPNILGIDRILDVFNKKLDETSRGTDQERYKIALALLKKIIFESNLWTNNFANLMRWDGVNSLQKWQLINLNGSPVKIRQSIHQIGVTQDYVVLMDTAFATGIEQVISNFPEIPLIKELARFIPSPDTMLYIVERNKLQENEEKVVAHKVKIPREAAHFLVDYENPNNKITLHIAHICAWDIAEWLRDEDQSVYDNETVPRELFGMHPGQMDIGFMGRYVIDVNSEKPKIIESQNILKKHDPCTWGPGLYTYLDRLPSSGMTPSNLDNIYWVSLGLWKELTTQFMYEQYNKYKYREVPLAEFIELAKQGKPACLYRLHTSSMTIEDYYEFPEGYMVFSPQFVPKRGREENSTNGYIVCIVFTPERDEIWIFDAENLNQNPLCKLYHPQLNLGLSLHTAWLQNISPRQANYNILVKQDYQEAVEKLLNFIDDDHLIFLSPPEKEQLKQEIKDLFEKDIYSRF
jgi:carotenoid cleavage dioxygenase-like enzyme